MKLHEHSNVPKVEGGWVILAVIFFIILYAVPVIIALYVW
jgi:hypothetical protein